MPELPAAKQKPAPAKKRGRPKKGPLPEPIRNWQPPETESADSITDIMVPIALTPDYFPRRSHTHIRDLTKKQRFGLRILTQGMQLEGTQLQNGGLVNNSTNAIRALLEILADRASEEWKG